MPLFITVSVISEDTEWRFTHRHTHNTHKHTKVSLRALLLVSTYFGPEDEP